MGHSESDGLRASIYQLNAYSSTPRGRALLDKAGRFTYSSSCLSLFFRIPLHEESVAAFEALSGSRDAAADAVPNGKAEDRAREMRMCCKTSALSMPLRRPGRSSVPSGEPERHPRYFPSTYNSILPIHENCGIVTFTVRDPAIPYPRLATARPRCKRPASWKMIAVGPKRLIAHIANRALLSR